MNGGAEVQFKILSLRAGVAQARDCGLGPGLGFLEISSKGLQGLVGFSQGFCGYRCRILGRILIIRV